MITAKIAKRNALLKRVSEKTIWFEKVREKIGHVVLASDCLEVTEERLDDNLKLFYAGKCPHEIIEDEDMWLYDVRSCAICGQGLGTV